MKPQIASLCIVTSMYCKTHIPNIRSALTAYECIKRHDYKQVFKHGLSTRDLSKDHLHLAVLKIFARKPANHLSTVDFVDNHVPSVGGINHDVKMVRKNLV